jgi:hypothetical protein
MEATVVWIAAEGATGSATSPLATPSEGARRSLEAWGRARGVKLVAPGEEPAPATAIDWAAGELVESEIARAREALVGLDFEATEGALGRAEAALRDHPELPQAAWLKAEIERTWSVRWLRANDEARAKRAWQRAASLDGGRAPGLGEKAFEGAADVTATVQFEGETTGATVRLDGLPITPGQVTRGEGEHALTAARADGAVAWAEWVSLAQGSVVRARLPEAPSCSRSDVAHARLNGAHGDAGDTVVAHGVRCGLWVAALEGGSNGDERVVRVATCEAESCSPLVEWRVAPSSSWTFAPAGPAGVPGGASPEPHAHWPAWATWTLVGVGVAGTAIAVVAAAGAFKSAPTETHFVNGGLQIHSF